MPGVNRSSEIDGAPANVAGGMPGETVRAEVVKVFPERVALKVVDVIEPSADRVEPPCPYYSDCSGCQWQHVAYQRQLDEKTRRVEAALAAHESHSERQGPPGPGQSDRNTGTATMRGSP